MAENIVPSSQPLEDTQDFVVEFPLSDLPDLPDMGDFVQSSSGEDTEAYDPDEFDPDDNDVRLFGYEIANDEVEDVFHPNVPLQNFDGDQDNDEDLVSGWQIPLGDDTDNIPFIPLSESAGQLNMLSECREPQDFFNCLFDHSMWSTIAEETNNYATRRQQQLGRDALERLDNPDYHRCSRLNDWKMVTENELKIFVSHLIVMGVLKKPELESYWSTSGLGRTPFFGKFMSRNRFTSILANLHLADDRQNPALGRPGHDPLAKLRPFVTMCQDNFRFAYKPMQNISMDEACCAWKGRLRFKCYNPRKPCRFHIKLYQMSESESGYIVGFNIYTGKGSCVNEASCISTECTKTTQIVMSLANDCQILDKGRHMYFDNYYTSPELAEELLYRDTLCCGTVRNNRKGLPEAVKGAKLKVAGQCVFRRNTKADGSPGALLAVKWFDKRPVFMVSTIHAAEEKWTGKTERTPEKTPIYKPSPIVDYTNKMGGVDMSDQLMTYYSFLRKSVKWWRKLWVHLLSMLILNAFVLNKKFGNKKKLTHAQFREKIAEYLIMSCGVVYLPEELDDPMTDVTVDRLRGKHFPVKAPIRTCKVCFRGKMEVERGEKPKSRRSTFECDTCRKSMCVPECFRLYHTVENYKDFV